MKINRISPDEHIFLKRLINIAKPPKTLHSIGILPEDVQLCVAIVGTRKPTAYGREVTEMLASGLAQRGVVIVSGLALGVDAIAHRATLDAGGTTVAVLGNGLPEIYPTTHRQLAHDIIKANGAIVSEYEPYEKAKSWSFLERNRIVSGLSDAVIVTEAGSRSGTFNTAMHALEQGKEVFVVPGNITSPMSIGCNQLLKQGATPITSIDDVFDVLTPGISFEQSTLPLGNTPLETIVIKLLQSGVRDGDELQQKANASATELSTTLTMLELSYIIKNIGNNQWVIR